MPFRFNLENIERSGLDVLFFGQDHYDTMAILDGKTFIDQDRFAEQLDAQKLFSNRQAMLRNFSLLISNLDECEKYIDEILADNQPSNTDIGNVLNRCMSQFTRADMQVLELMMQKNYKFATLTNNLSKLQRAQMNLTEKMNSVFAQYLNKYIHQ